MSYLLDWRIWALVFVLALAPIGYLKGRGDGRKIILAEQAADTLRANAEARALEQQRQRRADEAGQLAAARERGLRVDAARARDAVGGLRDDFDTLRAVAKSTAAADDALRVAGDVLRSCSAEYQRVAEEADRAYSEVKTLREAWPK